MPIPISQVLDEQPFSFLQTVVFMLVTGVLVLEGLDMQLLAYSAPLILKEWEIGKAALGPAMGAALLGMAVGTPFGGWLGDRYGRKWPFVVMIAFFSVATLSCMSARNVTDLTFLRILSGIGFGACFPNAIALLAEWIPRRKLSQVVGAMTVGVPAGGLLGAVLAILIIPIWGWRTSFLVGGLAPLILSLLVAVMLPESPAWLAKRIDNVDRISALFRRAWPTIQLPTAPVFVNVELLSSDQHYSAKVFEAGNLRVNVGICLAFFMNMFAAAAFIAWSPVILAGMGLPLRSAIAGSIYFSLSAIIATLGASFLAALFGTRGTMLVLACVAAIVSLALGTAVFLLAASYPGLTTSVVTGMAIAGGCLGGLQALLWVLSANAYSMECRTSGVAVASTAGRLGAITSSAGAGVILSLGTAATFFTVIAASLAMVAVGVAVVNRHVAATPKQPPAGERGNTASA